MQRPALRGECLLPVAFAVAGALFFAASGVAGGAAGAFLIERRLAVGGAERAAASAAQLVVAGHLAVADADPFIEDEAFALPQALFGGHLLEVIEDAALEVIDLLDPLGFQEGGALFAADPAGAEHRHFERLTLAQQACALAPEPRWKIAERGGLRVDRAGKSADRDLVVVAGVDHHGARIGDQRVPVSRGDIVPGASQRIDLRLAHGDDLTLEPHFHAVERLLARSGQLHIERGAIGQGADLRKHRGDALGTARNRAVDPLAGEQQRALDALRLAQRGQRRAQRGRIGEPGEPVQRGNRDGANRTWHRGSLNPGGADREPQGARRRIAIAKFN